MEKYAALRTVIFLHKGLAVLTLLAGLAISIFGQGLEVMAGIVGGVGSSLLLYAFAELLNIFINIEYNVKLIAENTSK